MMKFKTKAFLQAMLLVFSSSFVTWHIAQHVNQNTIGSNRGMDEGANLISNAYHVRGDRSDDNRQARSNISSPSNSLDRESERRNMTPEMALNYDFEEAAEVAEATGDFSHLSKFFDGLRQEKREQFFNQIPRIFSKLGPSHDIREKLAILDKVNTDATNIENMRRSIYEYEAVERFQEMKKESVLKTLSDVEFAAACRKLSTIRLPYAFQAASAAESEAAKRAAASAVAYSAMAGGTIAGSNAIAALPPGIVRDEAVAEMVIWLKQTGSEKEAAPWLDTIRDKKARARAMGN